ncbi:hypothetical protein RQP46_003825 [Phenoliferia psychrophenolica]
MGVPALFRWLSKKYPKIVLPVAEDLPTSIPGIDGTIEEIPVDTTQPNPNGEEFDNLYLDMNGIVHPCTHPEGKTAPETEEDMMKEVFLYTERVVAMVRPRKLLMIAIDGVAPRAKMNQQRSRRFRSAQEAKTKEEERVAAIAEWEAMGKEVSDEFRNKKGWDQNAITPGTPFMTLLAKSLRYWVAKKLNEDPGWAGLQVIISDASVPGEGEHKIMDFIRRQRSHASHDPNTKHVIYGLDADLIMLSLATHEPHFRVLREDVFAQDKKGRGCHTCGQMGHHSSQCKGKPKEMPGEADAVQKPTALKPFIFLDVSILREYLTVELSAPVHSFPFELERALDDWVFLIFFVGNDFLPHLPSLEIREGAIDVLMTIWKTNLDRMGGYLTEHGKVNLERAEVILKGLADREDEIFRKRREAEERQDRTDKRRRIDAESRVGGTHIQNGHDYVPVRPQAPARPEIALVPASAAPTLPAVSGLPQRPAWVVPPAEVDANAMDIEAKEKQLAGMVGSNSSIVANRKAIRMANISAADMIKAELASGDIEPQDATAVKQNLSAAEKLKAELLGGGGDDDTTMNEVEKVVEAQVEEAVPALNATPAVEEAIPVEDEGTSPRGIKRKAEGLEEEAEEDDEEDDETVDAFLASSLIPVAVPAVIKPAELKLLGNNMVEQEDSVKLWEPGYKERYYRQKFGVELSDVEFRKSVVKSYVEGLCWVLEYYFQGAPSWQWYYPHHFSPFASDFVDVIGTLDIEFTLGAPFKPYEQLMGVFPAGSRAQIPEPFQRLMTEPESPIIDFYPEEFDIDMNGKKMLWQGVALLPFIDPARLLKAMGEKYHELSEAEVIRNTMGTDVLFVSQDHPLYDYLEGLYTKRKVKVSVELDTKRSKGIAGYVLPDPDCIPSSTFDSPLPNLPDITIDRSISASYAFPPQKTPHRSQLLPGVKKDRAVLTQYDKDTVRRGAAGGNDYQGNGFHNQRQQNQSGPGFAKADRGGRNMGDGGRGGGGGGGGRSNYGPPQGSYQGQGGYGGPPQGGRDPYSGYQGGRDQQQQQGGGGGGYRQQPQQASYGGYGQGPPQNNSYGGYAGQSAYRPPPQQLYNAGGQQQPAYGDQRGPPPGGAAQPPPFQGYGGYGASGRGGGSSGRGGGGQGGHQRY